MYAAHLRLLRPLLVACCRSRAPAIGGRTAPRRSPSGPFASATTPSLGRVHGRERRAGRRGAHRRQRPVRDPRRRLRRHAAGGQVPGARALRAHVDRLEPADVARRRRDRPAERRGLRHRAEPRGVAELSWVAAEEAPVDSVRRTADQPRRRADPCHAADDRRPRRRLFSVASSECAGRRLAPDDRCEIRPAAVARRRAPGASCEIATELPQAPYSVDAAHRGTTPGRRHRAADVSVRDRPRPSPEPARPYWSFGIVRARFVSRVVTDVYTSLAARLTVTVFRGNTAVKSDEYAPAACTGQRGVECACRSNAVATGCASSLDGPAIRARPGRA